ncbi:MAG: Hsp20/alpha crystallin family protein [Corallococcus sp.]|nr:Hsp20/alpha crystallin family protein [Corallococcus sp.]
MKYYLTRKNHNDADFYDNAFENFFRPFFADEADGFMKTDVKETEKAYEMEIEMPGFEKDQINMSLDNGYITVSARKENKSEDKYLKRERTSSYSRSYYVGDVNQEEISAKYVNGILTVCVPKEQQKKLAHSINID